MLLILLAAGDLVRRVAGEDLGEGALAGAVGPHDGVDLPRVHGEVDAVQDLLLTDRGGQVLDRKHVEIRLDDVSRRSLRA